MSSSTWEVLDSFLKETRENSINNLLYGENTEMERERGRGIIWGIDNLLNLKKQLEGFDNSRIEEYKRSRG